ncbi:MAG: hypothetical protein WCT36_00540 [Candidatus Gracilibacteria bacterium]|jgi:hypothetical protein
MDERRACGQVLSDDRDCSPVDVKAVIGRDEELFRAWAIKELMFISGPGSYDYELACEVCRGTQRGFGFLALCRKSKDIATLKYAVLAQSIIEKLRALSKEKCIFLGADEYDPIYLINEILNGTEFGRQFVIFCGRSPVESRVVDKPEYAVLNLLKSLASGFSKVVRRVF